MRDLKEGEEVWTKRVEPDMPKPLTSAKAIRTLLEDLNEYFRQVLGRSGVPLQYICRKDFAPPDPNEEEDYGVSNDPLVMEMIRRAPLLGPAFVYDNHRVWHVIRHTTFNTDAWGWITQFERYGNGLEAYLALRLHYLGESHQSAIKTATERKKGKTGGEGGGENKGLGGTITGRFYSPGEWKKMTGAERQKALSLRPSSNTRNVAMVSNVEMDESRGVNNRDGNVVAVVTTGTQTSQRSHGPG
jgi:hypothetical protein